MAELENIEMVIEDENEHGVYALSLVDVPATGDETVLLSAEKEKVQLSELVENTEVVELAEVNEEKQLIMGVVLQPEQRIYRKSGDREYNIYFRSETVEKAAHMFIAKLNANNATTQHKESVQGVSVVESWTVMDSQKDKSAMYGKSYPVGSWVVMMKVYDRKMWEQFKEEGTTNISLEGMFKPKTNEFEERIKRLKSALSELTKEA